MGLEAQLQRQIDNPALSLAERTVLRCRYAKEFEESGNYEAARSAMGELWQRIGERPRLDGLDPQTAAVVLLRAGSLSGWIGSSRQIDGAQEIAKNLISESAARFKELQEIEREAEAYIDLGICYWREAAFDEARVTLRQALDLLAGRSSEQKARAFVNSAIVEISQNRYSDALHILNNAAPLVEASPSHVAKGRFHAQLALIFRKLGTTEHREDYIDRALVEFAAASYHYEQAGHKRYLARGENNLGFLLFTIGRLAEAHEHLDRALRLFYDLKDSGSMAQVNETRARVFLAQGRKGEAERAIATAVKTLEKGDEPSLLAEALVTQGATLARLGRWEEARLALERALAVAEQAGDKESAGVAALTIIEESGDHLTSQEIRAMYERADALLAKSQNTEALARLRRCARRVMAARSTRLESLSSPSFVYADERTAGLLRAAHLVATTLGAVLITGETGTGKESLARLIHQWSGRHGEFVAINCAALTDTLIESLLFGHRRGSFADAQQDNAGAVRQAAGGTLFLDGIAELSIGNQGKLLRLIEHGEIHAIGAGVPERVDVRVIAAANCDLRERVALKQFRDDLLYRLNTFHLEIPPLRERPADILPLAASFIKELVELHGKRVRFTPEAISAMCELPLKGNARELRSLIERTVLTATEGTEITRAAVEIHAARQSGKAALSAPWEGCSLREEVLSYESSLIKLALETAGGSVTHASRLLGITHQRLSSMLQSRHKNLLVARKPAQSRKHSIIRKL